MGKRAIGMWRLSWACRSSRTGVGTAGAAVVPGLSKDRQQVLAEERAGRRRVCCGMWRSEQAGNFFFGAQPRRASIAPLGSRGLCPGRNKITVAAAPWVHRRYSGGGRRAAGAEGRGAKDGRARVVPAHGPALDVCTGAGKHWKSAGCTEEKAFRSSSASLQACSVGSPLLCLQTSEHLILVVTRRSPVQTSTSRGIPSFGPLGRTPDPGTTLSLFLHLLPPSFGSSLPLSTRELGP